MDDIWDEPSLEDFGVADLNTLYRSYCLANDLPLPKKQIKASNFF
jgi:hypothetical protein